MPENTSDASGSRPRVRTNNSGTVVEQDALRREVTHKFGPLPNSFCLTPENPEITANLSGRAGFAYLDSPLDSLFKERLFIYLSRFCDVRYCIVRHVGFLLGLGRVAGDAHAPVQTIEEVIRLVSRPLPRLEQLDSSLAELNDCDGPLAEMPAPESSCETAIFACATHVFLQSTDAARCLDALRPVFGEQEFQYLLVFLAFVRMAHFWTTVQTDLRLEDDVKELLATHEGLADVLLNDPEAKATCGISPSRMEENIALRTEIQRDDERLRLEQAINQDNDRELRRTSADLVARVAELQKLNAEIHESRRAALNVMEDALLSRESLRDSEARARAIIDNLPGGAVFIVDRNLRYLFAQGEALATAGFTPETFIGKTVYEALSPEIAEAHAATLRLALEGAAFTQEHQAHGFWYLSRGVPLHYADGSVYAVLVVSYDITQRKEMEEALRLGEERYRLTVENLRDYAIFTLDTQGRVTSWSEGARRVKGYEQEEILGRHFRVFYIPEEQEAGKPEHEMQHAAETGRNEDESWRVRKDGSRFWGNEITTAIRDETETLRGFVKISRDLTERKQAEEQRLALESETVLLTERNRMAQELHDTLAQGFTGINLQLEVAEEVLEDPSSDPQEALTRLQRARDIALQSHQEARRSIRALRSPLLENLSLVEALLQLAQQASDRVPVAFEVEGTPFPLSGLVENDLYRIGQEALTNALRHSQAHHVTLTLAYEAEGVRLTIADDGQGFDPQMSRAGFGVTGMQERVLRLGTSLQIESQPGQGTKVELFLRLSNGAASHPPSENNPQSGT